MRAGHAIAHHGEDGAAKRDLDSLNLPLTQFGIERAAHGLFCSFRLHGRNGKADTVFRTALRDDDDGDLRVAQSTEQTLRRARHTDHAGTFQVHQCHVFDAGNALDGQRGRGVRANLRAGFLRGEGVANPDGNFARNGRGHRLRMDDLCAEVRQFHRFVVGQRIDDLCVRHLARVRREHAVYVRPDDDFVRG